MLRCVGFFCFVVAGCGHLGFDRGTGSATDAADSASIDDGPTILSCSGLASICGPLGTTPCCGSTLIPGGAFYRSYDVAADSLWNDMSFPATVSDFRLDTYEVTVGRFRKFVEDGRGTSQKPPLAGEGARMLNGLPDQGGWEAAFDLQLVADTSTLRAVLQCDSANMRYTWTDAPGANESLAMNCLTWYEAMAFCVWDGGFLPTEAEWNYAAAGGDEQRAYPWSSPASSLLIDCEHANYNPGLPAGPCVGAVQPVGSHSPLGDGRWGHADLGGNLWEWTLDYTDGVNYAMPCNDCADLSPKIQRADRGGQFGNTVDNLRSANRSIFRPERRVDSHGVRCARAP